MKKALIIATVGGFLQKFEMGNVRILQKMGYEVHYTANMKNQIYRFDQKELTGAGVRIHHMDIQKSPFALVSHGRAVRKLAELIRRENIGLIHCHTPVGGYLGRMAGKRSGSADKKVLYTAHGFHFYEGAPRVQAEVFRRVEQRLAKMTDVIITINKEDYRNACGFQMKPGGQVYQIPGIGLDMECFAPPKPSERELFRRRLGIPGNTFFLLSVGELNQNKNHSVILHAMHDLKNMGKDSIKIFYGICGEGPERQRLEAEIRELGLEGQAALYGYCDSVREYLAGADAFAFPSRREGLGMAALEALSMGIPVLAADNRGAREYMESGKNGYVCDWRDAAGFAEGIRKLQEMTEDERDEMKVYCRGSVRPFERKRTEAIMRQIYENISDES